MKNRLLVLTLDADDYCELLDEKNLPDLEVIQSKKGEGAEEKIEGCNIVLAEPDLLIPVLDKAKCLQWVQSTFAGVEYFLGEGLRRDYTLTGIKDVYGPVISEYVFGYMLALEREMFETMANQRKKKWEVIPYRMLKDLSFGICGLGSIGKHLAQTANYFGMNVIAYKRTPGGGDLPYVEKVYTGASFDEFLSLSDYLVLVLPKTPDTTGMIDARALKQMKSSAVLVNVGRGNAIIENDLTEALKNQVIKAAILDVFQEEPLPKSSELWELPNAIVTPHNAGFGFPKDIIQVFFDNYQRFIENKPLKYVIDFEAGY